MFNVYVTIRITQKLLHNILFIFNDIYYLEFSLGMY